MAPGEECATELFSCACVAGRKERSWPVSPSALRVRSRLRMATSSRLPSRAIATAYDRIVRRYYGFVRLKASSYFLAGGDADDLIQEGLVGLYKAVRDYRTDRESSFRNFAELCITRQIITAVKTATRNKHTPLNQYVSFSATPAGGERRRADARRGHPGPDRARPGQPGDLLRGAALARRLPVDGAVGARVARAVAVPRRLLLRAGRRAASAATPRPSTTRCSASSARSARTSPRATCCCNPRRVRPCHRPHRLRGAAPSLLFIGGYIANGRRQRARASRSCARRSRPPTRRSREARAERPRLGPRRARGRRARGLREPLRRPRARAAAPRPGRRPPRHRRRRGGLPRHRRPPRAGRRTRPRRRPLGGALSVVETPRLIGRLPSVRAPRRVRSASWPRRAWRRPWAVRCTREQAETWIRKDIAHWEVHDFGAWYAFERSTDQLVGRIGTHVTLVEGVMEVELAWVVHPDHWGQGYATELAAPARDLAYSRGLKSVVAFTLPDQHGLAPRHGEAGHDLRARHHPRGPAARAVPRFTLISVRVRTYVRTMREHPVDVGHRSEIAVLHHLTRRGYSSISRSGVNWRCDFLIDAGPRFVRVQCKTACVRDGYLIISGAKYPVESEQTLFRAYQGEIESFCAYCAELATRCIWSRSRRRPPEVRLRLTPPANNQACGMSGGPGTTCSTLWLPYICVGRLDSSPSRRSSSAGQSTSLVMTGPGVRIPSPALASP